MVGIRITSYATRTHRGSGGTLAECQETGGPEHQRRVGVLGIRHKPQALGARCRDHRPFGEWLGSTSDNDVRRHRVGALKIVRQEQMPSHLDRCFILNRRATPSEKHPTADHRLPEQGGHPTAPPTSVDWISCDQTVSQEPTSHNTGVELTKSELDDRCSPTEVVFEEHALANHAVGSDLPSGVCVCVCRGTHT